MSTRIPISLGDVIAERVLKARKAGQSFTTTVRLGRPVKSPDGSHYCCPYQVLGVGDDVVRSSAGEDSMQALELAFKMVGAELYGRHNDIEFTWLGKTNLGFPNPNE